MLLFLVLIPPYSYRIFAFTKYLFLYHLCSVPFQYSVHYIRKYMDILWYSVYVLSYTARPHVI